MFSCFGLKTLKLKTHNLLCSDWAQSSLKPYITSLFTHKENTKLLTFIMRPSKCDKAMTSQKDYNLGDNKFELLSYTCAITVIQNQRAITPVEMGYTKRLQALHYCFREKVYIGNVV